MTCRMFCIVIALMVLSISAILVANPSILGGFSSTLNGVPVQVKISQQDNGTITTMRTEDLMANRADYDGRFVRFIGEVKSVDWREPKKVELTVENLDDEDDGFFIHLLVYPLDAPHLPMEYQERHVYEFTGFLLEYDLHVLGGGSSEVLRVYAFEIRHHGKSESLREEERIEDAGSEDPLD